LIGFVVSERQKLVGLCDLDIVNFTLFAVPAGNLAIVCFYVEEVVALGFRCFNSKRDYVYLAVFDVIVEGLLLEKWVDLLYV
jgi:hypothetical protein